MERALGESNDWDRARELFLDLAERTPAEREEELAALGAEESRLADWVRRLLEQDADLGAPLDDPSAGETFGAYEAVRRLAVGGMGEVLLGRRSDGAFERQVAIKRLRFGGAELVSRFLRESRVLARLEHEYIARLLDGGTTASGRPYLVLEYVHGSHIDEHCRRAGLGVRARIELFRKVLEAVGHAHEQGVVHRDLKPSNILVREDGEPRLLDFGIARTPREEAAATRLTGTGQRLFTPEFASPEQILGEEASAASDTFSLGVVLYLLLAGVGPWGEGASLHELERAILERDPPPPSRHLRGAERRLVAGDLDTLVLRCLAKHPAERFAHVSELAAELDRHLQGLPIRTRPTTRLTRAVRYARRNPWQASSAAVLGVALVAIGLAWRSSRTALDRDRELVDTLAVGLEHARNLRSQDLNADAAQELRTILESLRTVEGQAAFEAEVDAELAGALLRTGEAREALAVVERGLALLPEDPALHASTRTALLLAEVNARRALSDPAAPAAAERAYLYATSWLERGDVSRLEAFELLAAEKGNPLEDRIAILAEGIAEGREGGRPHDGALGSLLTFQGVLLTEAGRYEEALPLIDEALAIDRWNHGEGHGDVALDRYSRGSCLMAMGRLDEAAEELEAALPTFEAMGHADLAAKTRDQLEAVRRARDENP